MGPRRVAIEIPEDLKDAPNDDDLGAQFQQLRTAARDSVSRQERVAQTPPAGARAAGSAVSPQACLGLLGSESLAADAAAVDAAPLTAPNFAERIKNRDYPSIFQAWQHVLGDDKNALLGRHDLTWTSPRSILKGNSPYEMLDTRYAARSDSWAGTYAAARGKGTVVLAAIHYRDARSDMLPAGHAFWKKDSKSASGQAEANDEKMSVPGQYYKLDFSNPCLRQQVARQCKAAILSGAFDGCMFDWWDDTDGWDDPNSRKALIADVRSAIGDNGLVLVNVNNRRLSPDTVSKINGVYMEGLNADQGRFVWKDWSLAAQNVEWFESSLKEPRLVALEAWSTGDGQDPAQLTTNENLKNLRAVTALMLTHSDGYALFSLPNGAMEEDKTIHGHDHFHRWDDFWRKGLGKPRGEKGFACGTGSALFCRRFENGAAVYNPTDKTAQVCLQDLGLNGSCVSRAARQKDPNAPPASCVIVPAHDGDILSPPSAD